MALTDKIASGAQYGVTETTHVVGKEAAVATIHTGMQVGSQTGAAAAGAGMIAGGVGLTAAVSAAVAQMEYEGKRREIKNFLRGELASLLGKSEGSVKTSDIDKLAKVNHTVSEQLVKEKRLRNIGIGTISAATFAAVGVVLLATPAIAAIPILAASPVLSFIASAVVAIGAYSLVKSPLDKLGLKLFNGDKKTSYERIEDIHKDHELGKSITRERVFAVFVQSNPELDNFIRTRYGKKFDDLAVADKLALTDLIGSKLGVAKMTDDINHSRVKATELVFAVQGQISGVLPKEGEAPKHSVLMTIKRKLHDVGEAVAHPIEHQHQVAERSFVERLGRAPIATGMGHVQQLEESRAAATLSQRGA